MPTSNWKRPAVILNRESGTISGIGPEVVEEGLREIFQEFGVEASIKAVRGEDITAAVTEARDGDADVVIIGGGDGTVASAASLMSKSDKPLGILPLGTFNLAARDVGMSLDWKEAVREIMTAPVASLDMLDVNGELFFCVVVLGFYPTLAIGKEEYHGNWIVKSFKSMGKMLKGITTVPPLNLVLHDEKGQVTRHRSRMVLLANNDYEDMFGLIPLRRSLDAGYFTVYISTHRTRWGMLKSVLAWMFGRWRQDREMVIFHATDLEVNVRRRRRVAVMRDGELIKLAVPFQVKLRPKVVNVVVPRIAKEAGEG